MKKKDTKYKTLHQVLYELLCEHSGDKVLEEDKLTKDSHMRYLVEKYVKDKSLGIPENCILDKEKGVFLSDFDNLFDVLKYIEENYESEKEPKRTGKEYVLTPRHKKDIQDSIDRRKAEHQKKIEDDRIEWENDMVKYSEKRKQVVEKVESFFEYKPSLLMRLLKWFQPFKELNERSKERFIKERLELVDKDMKEKYDSIYRMNRYVDIIKKQERGIT